MNREYSLRGGAEFQRAWDNGKVWSHPLIVLRASANGMDASRFGFVVGKKVGKAVRRNRVKRLMREAVRHRLREIAKGWDIILIARGGVESAEFKDIDAAVENLLQRARLILNSQFPP
jgi:ribonuclease P protein component